jgi:hypothetical protein
MIRSLCGKELIKPIGGGKPVRLMLALVVMIYKLKVVVLIIKLALKLLNQFSKKSKEKDIKTGTLRGGQENEEEISRLLAVDLEKAIETVQSFLLDPIFVVVKMQKLMLIWTTNYTTNEFSSYNSYKSKSKLTRLKQSFQTTLINIIFKSEKEKSFFKRNFFDWFRLYASYN